MHIPYSHTKIYNVEKTHVYDVFPPNIDSSLTQKLASLNQICGSLNIKFNFHGLL